MHRHTVIHRLSVWLHRRVLLRSALCVPRICGGVVRRILCVMLGAVGVCAVYSVISGSIGVYRFRPIVRVKTILEFLMIVTHGSLLLSHDTIFQTVFQPFFLSVRIIYIISEFCEVHVKCSEQFHEKSKKSLSHKNNESHRCVFRRLSLYADFILSSDAHFSAPCESKRRAARK